MARAISVKVPTSLVIAEIENRLAEIDKAIASYPSDVEKYNKAIEAYKKKVAKFVSDYLAKNASKVGFDFEDTIRLTHNYENRLTVNFDSSKIEGFPEVPVKPEEPNKREWIGREHINRKALLEKNLRVLKMTTQEEVNASTYSSVMELL